VRYQGLNAHAVNDLSDKCSLPLPIPSGLDFDCSCRSGLPKVGAETLRGSSPESPLSNGGCDWLGSCVYGEHEQGLIKLAWAGSRRC
jgi:hypothetical protein